MADAATDKKFTAVATGKPAPATSGDPPAATTSKPPATTISDPPAATTSKPPATTISDPPAATTSKPPATTIGNPPAATGNPATTTIAGRAEPAPGEIERRWQDAWRRTRAFATPPPGDGREPAYVFAGCPFTSGAAHMGHIRSYSIADAYARFLRARGRAVLFSLGFDSFGLPAELEALRRGISPQQWVESCCTRMRRQFERLGYSCDWDRSFVSSEPEHYRWTQRLFLKMLEHGLIYRREGQVSRCDSCETVLAAIQVEEGRCWRCHSEVRLVRTQQWFVKITAYVEDNERGLDRLRGWDRMAIGAQRAVIGRVDGVELDARTLQQDFTVFTPHADAIERASFVAISPAHPLIEQWTDRAEIADGIGQMREVGLRREDRDAARVALVLTDELAIVAGVAQALPIVISPLVDGRYGPTAVLGMPELDPTDRVISERLSASPRMTLKVAHSRARPRPAVRYRARDFAISRQRAWGAPIPLIDCPGCGTVPVAPADLPVRLPADLAIAGEGGNALAHRPDFYECACPRCGGPAHRETDTIDCHLDGMWMWMPICVPPAGRRDAMFAHPEYARWLPVAQIVWGADAGGYMFDQRIVGKLLHDLGELPPLPGREPFDKALMHQMIQLEGHKMSKHLGNAVDPDALVERHGADAVRLAVLHAAAPRRSFDWNEHPLREAERFLRRLLHYGEPRLAEWGSSHRPAPALDSSDRLRRRLARWCDAAIEKTTADLERLELQRAAHNSMLLLTRIEDFEQRALARADGGRADGGRADDGLADDGLADDGLADDGLADGDREAVIWGLLRLVRLLAPLTPHMAEELWHAGGNDSLVSCAPWPEPSRSTRAPART